MPGALARWEPFAELAELRSHFDRMFSDVAAGRDRASVPTIDVSRQDASLVVRVDIPGIKPEEVKVEVDHDVLTVSGEHEERQENNDKQYVRRERRYGAFSRSLPLPAGVDVAAVTAQTRDGVLTVTVPLPSEAAQPPVTITPTAP